MKHNCEVVRDLLPLYHDGVCSKKSREMVEEHITECEACKKELEEIKKELIWNNHSEVIFDYSLIPPELIREV